MRLIKKLFGRIFLLATLFAAFVGYQATRPLPLPTQLFEFSLMQGSSLTSAANQLQQAGVLPDSWALIWLARLLGKAAEIKAGNYQLVHSVTLLELLNIMTKGQVNQEKLVIIEGWTFKQLRAALDDSPVIRHDSEKLSDSELLHQLGVLNEYAEGQFFPDTYYFSSGTSDLALLKRAYQNMQTVLQDNWQARAPGLPLKSPYHALILASIVEKETGQAIDRTMIAAVFINRLRRGMMLQTDPTVIYGMGDKFKGNLRRRDLLADTPYNTYKRYGLPPTPIALPGLAALQATLHPASTNVLYFVARGDGSSEFSGSLIQHNRAVDRYQK